MSGNIILVVPNVMGMCLWSPPLDALGNSCRGIQYIEVSPTMGSSKFDKVQLEILTVGGRICDNGPLEILTRSKLEFEQGKLEILTMGSLNSWQDVQIVVGAAGKRDNGWSGISSGKFLNFKISQICDKGRIATVGRLEIMIGVVEIVTREVELQI